MPRPAFRRGAPPIADHLSFQLLAHQVDITVDDPRITAKLAYLVNDAEQPVEVRWHQAYEVRGEGPYELRQDGDVIDVVTTPDDVLFVVYGRCYGRACEPFVLDGWVQLHGGVVRIDGRRMLLVGDKGTGKTTLALRLLYDGHGHEGDELVFTRGGVAMPAARNLHVKAGSRALVPELATGWEALPSTGTDDGEVIRALNPRQAGFGWEIMAGSVDLVVVLEAAHGEVPTARRLTGPELVQHVVPHATPATPSRSDLLRALTSLLGRVPGHLVRVGELGGTAAILTGLEA